MSLIKRRRPDPVEPVEPVESVGSVVEPAVQPALEAGPAAPDLVEVRALRAQVRVLEEALQRVVDPPSLEEYRTLVRAAVRAVALGTTAETDPRAAVARVTAALERIDRPVTGRVHLPPPPRVAPPVAEPGPATAPEPEATAPTGPAEPVPTEEDEVVLPVPPPASDVPRRARRRRTRSAA